MDITLITPYAKNAKKHSQKQIKQVAESIKRFGFVQPLVIDKNNEVVIGHCRLEAAKLLGLKDVPIISVENLTDEEVRALRLADNKLNESEWDMKLVIDELKGLEPEMFDLTGFDRDLLIEPDEKDDLVPENVPVKAKLGDLYQLGNHRVLCGDSTKKEDVEKLMDGKKADMVFTDPPYGVDYSGGIQFKNGQVLTNQREKLIADDTQDIYAKAVPMMAEYCDGPIYTWFAGTKARTIYTAIEGIGDLHSLIIWVKNGGGCKEHRESHNRPMMDRILTGKRNTDDLEIVCRVCNALDFLERKNPENAKNYKINYTQLKSIKVNG